MIGLSEPSVESVLKPASTLAHSAPYTAASAALGEGVQPSLLVDFPTFLGLLEGVGLSEEPAISKFVPYLRSLTTLAGGGKNSLKASTASGSCWACSTPAEFSHSDGAVEHRATAQHAVDRVAATAWFRHRLRSNSGR